MACDHSFCLGCIRNWRATGEVDAKTVSCLGPVRHTHPARLVPAHTCATAQARVQTSCTNTQLAARLTTCLCATACSWTAAASCFLLQSAPACVLVALLQALRTCPLCRTTTHFITPSTTWPETPAEKEAILDAYRASMAEKVSMFMAHETRQNKEQCAANSMMRLKPKFRVLGSGFRLSVSPPSNPGRHSHSCSRELMHCWRVCCTSCFAAAAAGLCAL